MARSYAEDMTNALDYLINKSRDITLKKQLMTDLGVINDSNITNKEKEEAYDRLIKYISHMDNWEEEVLTYLADSFAKIKAQG